MFFITTVDYT